ncbi:hypothetical protein NDR87_31485 [Nocardia sp. CDC159]|uniref:Uncharacterized protein n=1 Tax=Nocardia pulmonis TaxID=2951408 RepID=A0A9X2EBR9_9NOCA|nr:MULTISPECIES: hypothetical protein [Nocardia]MCM6777927.1 hypothetical protein [Nocardia pulmonis]MCM6790902.1 hypothetical protein [Nocardia sp. CDC159]
MTNPRNVVDLVADEVIARLREEIASHIAYAADMARADVHAAARQQFAEFLATLPAPGSAAAVPAKMDARERAQRTAVQGAVATVAVAVLLAVAGAISGDGFDWASSGDWKAVAGAALGAGIAAGAAYVQRLVSPPHVPREGETE